MLPACPWIARTSPRRPSCAPPGTYARSIRSHLRAIGAEDLPRNGAFILFRLHEASEPRDDLPAGLGVSKQAVSQAIDILVNRGYVDRSPDPSDRRRITLELTERGHEVVAAVWRGTEAIDSQLAARVSIEAVEAMRSGLMALADIKAEATASGAGVPRSSRRLPAIPAVQPDLPGPGPGGRAAPLHGTRMQDLRLRGRRRLRVRQPRPAEHPPHPRPGARARRRVPRRARRRCPLRGVEQARCRRPHPPRRTDAVRGSARAPTSIRTGTSSGSGHRTRRRNKDGHRSSRLSLSPHPLVETTSKRISANRGEQRRSPELGQPRDERITPNPIDLTLQAGDLVPQRCRLGRLGHQTGVRVLECSVRVVLPTVRPCPLFAVALFLLPTCESSGRCSASLFGFATKYAKSVESGCSFRKSSSARSTWSTQVACSD